MAAALEEAAVLYVDGHVRVYHGSQTPLPKHFVRERLCLRATADYWVNAMGGQPLRRQSAALHSKACACSAKALSLARRVRTSGAGGMGKALGARAHSHNSAGPRWI
jgi:hypothetical protein